MHVRFEVLPTVYTNLTLEDGASMFLLIVSICLQFYTGVQPQKPDIDIYLCLCYVSQCF